MREIRNSCTLKTPAATYQGVAHIVEQEYDKNLTARYGTVVVSSGNTREMFDDLSAGAGMTLADGKWLGIRAVKMVMEPTKSNDVTVYFTSDSPPDAELSPRQELRKS